MSEFEHFTVALPSETADVVRGAVEAGDYASASEVVHAALRDWKLKRARQDLPSTLETDIATGLADVAAGRVFAFDAARIIERGRQLSAVRSPSD